MSPKYLHDSRELSIILVLINNMLLRRDKMPPTKDERAKTERFLNAFNQIHDYMKQEIKTYQDNFGILLGLMNEKTLIKKRDYDFLDNCRELRNHIVHSKKRYMAIPSIETVERLERILNRFENLPTVHSVFGGEVRIIQADETMYHVMKIVEDTGFTQFPVYNDDQFVNLMTENILTRWLARHVVSHQEMAFADLRDTAADALRLLNDDDKHWEFIPRHMTITAATNLFASRPVLEALIITERGNVTDSPLGIVTRSDALDMLDGIRNTHTTPKV
ncbi:MAG: hypothetical protein AAF846_29090 [Chloroflexota bacterium]